MRKSLQHFIKRGVDIVGAGAGLVALAPVMGATAAAIRFTMGSPVLFRQQRPGLHCEPFCLIKFRTMAAATEGQGVESDGLRLTPLGKSLRKLSLDELPTLWNVLMGDMTLVGPRPLLMQYLERYSREQARRHEAVPGVTGWAQVNGRNAIGWDRKFELDVWYVDNWSLSLDLQILWQTVAKVLSSKDINEADNATMSEFMGAEASKSTVVEFRQEKTVNAPSC